MTEGIERTGRNEK